MPLDQSGVMQCLARITLQWWVIVAVQLASPTTFATDFNIEIKRRYQSSVCTSGDLYINGTWVAYALERPWVNNLPFISSVPPGSYQARLRYDHSDKWRVELIGVPGRTHVQIHIGNVVQDSVGCILVGKQLMGDACTIRPGTSKAAYDDMKRLFYGTEEPVSTPDKAITVSISDMG